jgi:hypothetical protein
MREVKCETSARGNGEIVWSGCFVMPESGA